MALKKTVSIKTTAQVSGPAGVISSDSQVVEYQGAYIRIDGALVTKDKLVANVTTYREAGGPALSTSQHELPYSLLSGENALAQAYEAMKQLPEFAGAEDA